MRILYVEDNRELRETIGMLMEAEGRTVTSCATAEEALKLDAQQGFDLLVSDVSLPGMSGTELARQLLAEEDAKLLGLIPDDATELTQKEMDEYRNLYL